MEQRRNSIITLHFPPSYKINDMMEQQQDRYEIELGLFDKKECNFLHLFW